MRKTAIFYGSSMGTTEEIANKIGGILDAEVFNVADNPCDEIENYDNLILGTSTSGVGDLQEDWEDFLSELENADLDGKTIALFGLGDGASFPDSFAEGMFRLYEVLTEKECNIIGFTDVEGYEFDESMAVVDGQFVGLAIDEENQPSLTDERIEAWIEAIKPSL